MPRSDLHASDTGLRYIPINSSGFTLAANQPPPPKKKNLPTPSQINSHCEPPLTKSDASSNMRKCKNVIGENEPWCKTSRQPTSLYLSFCASPFLHQLTQATRTSGVRSAETIRRRIRSPGKLYGSVGVVAPLVDALEPPLAATLAAATSSAVWPMAKGIVYKR